MALPAALGYLLQALHLLRPKKFAPLVALGHEAKLLLQRGGSGVVALLQCGGIPAGQLTLQLGDAGVAQQHLKAGAHLVDAVVVGFELGGLINHIFRGRDLAAVVQPGADAKFPPGLLTFQVEVGQRPLLRPIGRFGQQHRRLRHTLTPATGVRALGVNRSGQQGDDCIDQLLLALQQPGALQTNGRLAGQGLDQGLVESVKGSGLGMGCLWGDQGGRIVLAMISCNTPTISPLVERIGTVNIDTAR